MVTWRRKNGLATNVPRIVTCHATSYDIGNSGQGATELALNILTHVFPPTPADHMLCKNGSYTSQIAWQHTQSFKLTFIAPAPRRRGRLEWAAMERWIRKYIPEVDTIIL